MKIFAKAEVEKYDIKEIYADLKDQEVISSYKGVLHVRRHHEDVFIFPFGVTVSWYESLAPDELDLHREDLNYYTEKEFDEFTVVDNNHFNILEDEITIPNNDIETKLAVSYAIAQSTKISHYETKVNKLIKENYNIPKNLSASGKIGLSRAQIQKKLGQLFIEKHYINLHTDSTSTPEIIWDMPEIEEYYIRTSKYLEISQRVQTLNRQLNTLNELFDMLKHELDVKHSSKLEWIIIILIAFEIIMSLTERLL